MRALWSGGVLSYRALFNWTTPSMFIGTLLLGPLLEMGFFVYLGRQLGVGDDRWFVVGNAILSASLAGVFGGTMAIANERRYGTLGCVLMAPRAAATIFLARVVPYAGNGLLVSVFSLGVGCALFGVGLPASALAGLGLVMVASAVSCAFFGLVLGAIGLRLRDVWVVSNLAAALLLLLSGVNAPTEQMPAFLRGAGAVLPITHAATAARGLAAGDGLAAVAPQIGFELGLAVVYAVLAAVLLSVLEVESRRRASLGTS